MMLAPGHISPVLGAVSILAIAVGAGASGALNQWYDADIDAVMTRTRKRPIPAGIVTGGEALGFGLVLSVLSVMTLGLMANWVAGALLAFTIFFYAVVYTMWLKRSTPQNIVIGGAAGAFPPMIGWAAVTGGVSLESFVLFLIIFLWTPPHFWALALFKSDDYGAAGMPMMPNVAGEPQPTARCSPTRCSSRRSACCLTSSALPDWLTPPFQRCWGLVHLARLQCLPNAGHGPRHGAGQSHVQFLPGLSVRAVRNAARREPCVIASWVSDDGQRAHHASQTSRRRRSAAARLRLASRWPPSW